MSTDTCRPEQVGLRKPRTRLMQQEGASLGIKIWFLMQQSGDASVSLRKLVRDGDDASQFVCFGQKLRVKELECSDSEGSAASCTLPFRGTHAVHNYALLERGTELSIRIICEENWAYENDHLTLRLRIVAPEQQQQQQQQHLQQGGLVRTRSGNWARQHQMLMGEVEPPPGSPLLRTGEVQPPTLPDLSEQDYY